MTNASFRARAHALDAADALSSLRREFSFPTRADGRPVTYLCGHSLGLATRGAVESVQRELDLWRTRGVEGHFTTDRPWVSYHEELARGFAALAGAEHREVVAMNSLTVNLHLMLVSFYRPTATRHKILIERAAFSSDRYAVESQIRFHGFDPERSLIELGPRDGEDLIREADLLELIAREGASIATVLWPGVQYLTGQAFDLRSIARAAHEAGASCGFDLAHAIGNVPLALHASEADFAVWCGYKYLNGGPGAIGGCFVHDRHARSPLLPRFAGWWGHDKLSRFEMPAQFRPLDGAEGWQLSNPPIFSAAPLITSLALFERAGLDPLREKSLALFEFFVEALASQLDAKLELVTPREAARHGAQLSLRLRCSRDRAKSIYDEMNADGYICDWREPDIVRVSAVPLYNTFGHIAEFVDALAAALAR